MIRILSVENMRASDRATIENGTSGAELMQRAAKGIYDAVGARKEWTKTLIVCGCGNNAGDGFALAGILKDNNVPCVVWLLSDRFSDDGRFYYEACISNNITIVDNIEDCSEFGIIVDCIFGTGFHGMVEEPYRSAIERINASGAFVVSADINSGLNGESGRVQKGSICVKSDLTVSIGDYKPGLFLADAKDVIADKVNCDIGIIPVHKSFMLVEKSDVAHALGLRKHNSHKGTYGYIALIGGCVRYSGAIKLANLAQSAMRSGAGVVKLAVPQSICEAVMPHLLESTLYPLNDNNGEMCFEKDQIKELISGVSTVAVGMGIGNSDETFKLIEYLLKNYGGNLIIDADGLNALSNNTDLLKESAPKQIILTPHPKEFSRLSGYDMNTILEDPCIYAKSFAKEYGVIVLLKGATTVISDGEQVLLCDRGCGGMATAGSGDVLSGIVSAVASYNDDSLLATAAAAYINGLAGELAGEKNMISMIASDTILCIKDAINTFFE